MATLIEDERDALEDKRLEEELRLREEAAQVLVQQDALATQQAIAAQQQQSLPPIPQSGNYMNQPQGEINALQTHFNEIAAGRGLPTTRTTDSQEYLDEVAKAQRNSGFINANVNDFGKVIQAGYDPMRDPVAIKAQQEANNLQRQNYVDSLIKGGATYAEAYRAGQGRYPQTGNEAMRLKVEQLAQKQSPADLMQPEIVDIDGVKMFRTGRNSFARVNEPKPAVVPKAVMPPDVAASQRIISGKITDARAEVQRAQKRVDEDGKDAAALNASIRAKAKLKALEDSLVTGSTNWMNTAQAPAPVASTPAFAKAVNEVKRMTKGGRRAVYDAETKEFIRYE